MDPRPDDAALAAFLTEWDRPPPVDQGSRQGLDDKEAAIAWAAQQFAGSSASEDARRWLTGFLRPKVKPTGAWDYAGIALVILEKGEAGRRER